MGVVGTLLKNRRAGEAKLAWNLPNLSAPETLADQRRVRDGEAIPAEHAGKRAAEPVPAAVLERAAGGTAELLLVIEDTDVPMPRPFVHCVALIEPRVRELPPAGWRPEPGCRGARAALRDGAGVPRPGTDQGARPAPLHVPAVRPGHCCCR